MTENKIESFNIEPLVFEIENVIKNGLKVLLKDYIVRHDLLEKTHKQIMKLPSVMNEINKGSESDSDSQDDVVDDKSMFVSISDMTRDLVKKEISFVESKLDRIEKKYESISPLISRILDKLESINDEVKVLKENPRDSIKIVKMDHEKSYIIKPSIVSACENENIKFEIHEDDEEDDDDEDDDDDDEVEIIEPVKVKKEEIIIKYEDELEEDVVEDEEVEEDVIEEDVIEPVVVADIKEDSEEEELEEEEELVEEKEEELVEEKENELVEEEEEVETEASEGEDEVPAEEEELEIITIDDIDYCTDDLENGFIWELSEDGEQGNKIGYLKEGEPFFYADEN